MVCHRRERGVTFGPLGVTLMAGTDAQMNAETTYFAALGNVTGYTIADGKLTLTGKDGETLLTFSEVTAVQTPVPITGNWTLSTDKNVTLSFGTEGAFNGHAPVNLYFGSGQCYPQLNQLWYSWHNPHGRTRSPDEC